MPDKKQPTPGPWLRRGRHSVTGPDNSGPGGRNRRTICMIVEADAPQSQADLAVILCAHDLLAALTAQTAYYDHVNACRILYDGGCAECERLFDQARRLREAANDLLRVEGLL